MYSFDLKKLYTNLPHGKVIEKINDLLERCLKGGGGGVQGLKSWKHDFEITGDPKGPPIWTTFWSSFEAPNPYLGPKH